MARSEPLFVSPDTRHSLVLRLRDPRDAASWEEFVRLYEPLILNVARGGRLQEADARDVTQQVLMNVARSVERWVPGSERGSFRGWLFRVTRNVTINLLVQRSRREQGSGDSRIGQLLEQEPAADAPETAEFDLHYRRHLFHQAAGEVRQQFQATTWEAFWRTCVQGHAIRDVAAELKISVGAIYIARSRVVSRLRQQVQRREDIDEMPSHWSVRTDS